MLKSLKQTKQLLDYRLHKNKSPEEQKKENEQKKNNK